MAVLGRHNDKLFKVCFVRATYMGADDASGMLLMAVKVVACPTIT